MIKWWLGILGTYLACNNIRVLAHRLYTVRLFSLINDGSITRGSAPCRAAGTRDVASVDTRCDEE